ncbi:MAG: ROK family protein [Bryobacteraceae bacterium]
MIGAIDIGGTKIATGIVDGRGRIVARAECPTAPQRGFADGIARMADMLRETAAAARAELHGIGIGCTGPVDPMRGVLGSVDLLPGWRGGQIVAELSSAFGVPAAMENDADAAGLAEFAWGAGRGKSRFLYVTVGTGIGVAIILDGALYRGVDGSHPEIGHTVIDASGPLCYCGARGCWEILASGPALLAAAKAATKDLEMSVERLGALAESGDAVVLSVMEREGHYLGLGLANLINTFCPDMIALGGGVMRSGRFFMDRARQVIRESCKVVPSDKAELALAALGPDAALIGAAQAWVHRFGTERESHAV